ncbi:transmembrane protein 187 [Psammomys obesus]|uniref:transmembrane protein 187 n=1 Tax=Psammomys obesus TaxID=48139 RepID=UPI002452B044|nr:transmembrane protein 187 [Psammomys obesus]
MGIFNSLFIEVAYEHYSEAPVANLPMPFNVIINMVSMLLGVYCYNLENKIQEFEVALDAHVVAAIKEALCTHKQNSNISTATYLALGLVSFLGFEVLYSGSFGFF